MQKPFDKNFIEYRKTLEMTPKQKDLLLSRIHEGFSVVAPQKKRSFLSSFMHSLTRIYVVVPSMLVLCLMLATMASASALPGDFLYPVKLQAERMQVGLAATPEKKLDLEVRFAQRRLTELTQTKRNNDKKEQTNKIQEGDNKVEEWLDLQVNENPEAVLGGEVSDESENKFIGRGRRGLRARLEAANSLSVLKKARENLQGESGEQKKRLEKVDKTIEDLEVELSGRSGRVRGARVDSTSEEVDGEDGKRSEVKDQRFENRRQRGADKNDAEL